MKKKVCIIFFIIFFSISIFFSEKVFALEEDYRDEAAKKILQQLEETEFENDNKQNSSSTISIPPIEKTDESISEVVEGTLEKIQYIVIVMITIIRSVLLF